MHAHPEFVASFSAALAHGTVPPGVTATAPDEAALRFAVYRNNVTVSLIDALAQRFPVIVRLVGPEFFRAMARDYAQTDRPTSPVLQHWGVTFPDYLAGFTPLAAYPYMADVARIELARGQAFHAADADPVPAADLVAAAVQPQTLFLQLHPAVQVLRLAHPAVSIWAANQPAAPLGLAATGPEIALIWRDTRFEVPVAAISPGDATLLEAVQAGFSLLHAAVQATSAEPDHNPQPLLVTLMQAGAFVIPKAIP